MMPQQYKLQPHRHPPREAQPSEEDHSRSNGGTSATKRKEPFTVTELAGLPLPATTGTTNNNDGATIEVARKPRGRPPGSKNKTKAPIVIEREADNGAMRPHVLEISGGCDVVEAVAQFVRRGQFGLCVISGSGSVANVTLRRPTAPGATVTFHGRFDILSLSAIYLASEGSSNSTVANSGGFTISLAGAQGQVVGGSVVGPLLAAGTVVIVAASFANSSFHRLLVEEETSETRSQTADQASSSPLDLCAMPVYSVAPIPMSCHLPSDVFWTPSVRPPPPPY